MSGAGVSSVILVVAGLASFVISSKPIASGWEASLLISDLTWSCWNVRSTNRASRGWVAM